MLQAIDRYDGPAYRVLRRCLKITPSQTVDVYIVSAEFGLLSALQEIPTYDRLMTVERAEQLRHDILRRLEKVLITSAYDDVFVCMGRTYHVAIAGVDQLISPSMQLKMAAGSLGRQLSQLYDWLNGSASPGPTVGSRRRTTPVRLRGVEVEASLTDALSVSRQAIDQREGRWSAYQSWYVAIDGHRIAPKWLVSRMTGLPVSRFTTDDARRVLASIGLEVHRVAEENDAAASMVYSKQRQPVDAVAAGKIIKVRDD